MQHNYLKIAIRNFLKFKSYNIINLLCLSVAMAICLVLANYARYEMSFDRHNADFDDIYRITMDKNLGDVAQSLAATPYPIAPILSNEHPQIEAIARIRYAEEAVVVVNQQNFGEDAIYFAETALFETLSFDFVHGDASTALNQPFTTVVSQTIANKYFGNAYPIGKTIELNFNGFQHALEIVGVVNDVTEQAHFRPEILVHLDNFPDFSEVPKWTQSWYDEYYWTYIKTSDIEPIKEALSAFIQNHYPREQVKDAIQLKIQALSDIHLKSDLSKEISVNGSGEQLRLFLIIGFVILALACFNFVNLTLAQSGRRFKEVGVRKVMGAKRKQLVTQFLLESITQAFTAGLIALAAAVLFGPYLADLTGYHFQVELNNLVLIGLPVLALVIGLTAGLSPSIYLSALKPALILKGRTPASVKHFFGRHSLVMLQMAASMVLLIIVLGMKDQIDFLLRQDLGFDKAHTVVISSGDTKVEKEYEQFRNTLLSRPSILKVAGGRAPGMGNSNYPVRPAGDDLKKMIIPATKTDAYYLDAYNIELVAGRAFRWNQAKGRKTYFYLNQSAAAAMGWSPEEAIGKKIDFGYNWYYEGEVVGVIADYNFSPLTQKIEPLIVWQKSTDHLGDISIKVGAEDISATISFIENTWKEIETVKPFAYRFLNEKINENYAKYENSKVLVSIFSLIVVVISSIGMIGMMAFTISRKMKEMSIRKILGASRAHISGLFYAKFLTLMSIAIAIAIPSSFYFLSDWLSNFAYAISPGAFQFLIPVLILFVFAGLVISFQVIKSTVRNPVDYIRND